MSTIYFPQSFLFDFRLSLCIFRLAASSPWSQCVEGRFYYSKDTMIINCKQLQHYLDTEDYQAMATHKLGKGAIGLIHTSKLCIHIHIFFVKKSGIFLIPLNSFIDILFICMLYFFQYAAYTNSSIWLPLLTHIKVIGLYLVTCYLFTCADLFIFSAIFMEHYINSKKKFINFFLLILTMNKNKSRKKNKYRKNNLFRIHICSIFICKREWAHNKGCSLILIA